MKDRNADMVAVDNLAFVWVQDADGIVVAVALVGDRLPNPAGGGGGEDSGGKAGGQGGEQRLRFGRGGDR